MWYYHPGKPRAAAGTRALYDRIGVAYDQTRRPDPRIVDRLASHLRLSPGGRYLDVACGTGNYTTLLAARGGHWYAVDLSATMVQGAKRKPAPVSWILARVDELPIRTSAVSGAICTLAIHHFATLEPVFTEVRRVLAGGSFVIFTSTPDQMGRYWLNQYFPDAMAKAIAQMPSLRVVEDALRAVGFTDIEAEPFEVPPDLTDLFLYAGKHRPELYLSDVVRRGISTFAALADKAEVDHGTTRLGRDIESGEIESVIHEYASTGGDYVFVVAH